MADTSVTKKAKAGFGKKIKSFFVETKSELKKCTWPTKDQLIHNTLVIIAFVAIVAVILSVLDFGFQSVINLLVK